MKVAPGWRRWRRPHRAGRGSRYRKLSGMGKLVDASDALDAAADLPLGGMAAPIDAFNWPRRASNCSVGASPPPSYMNDITLHTTTHTHTLTSSDVKRRRTGVLCATRMRILTPPRPRQGPVKAPSKFLLPAFFGYRSRYWKDSWHCFESLCCFQRLSHLSCQDDQLQPWKILSARASRRAAGFADGSGIHPTTRWHFGFVSRCRGFETQLKCFCDGQRFSRCSTGCLRDWWSLL